MFMVVRVADHQLFGSLGDWARLVCLVPLGAVVYIGTLSLVSRATAVMVFDSLRQAFQNFGRRGFSGSRVT
jgi:hypothetical protein